MRETRNSRLHDRREIAVEVNLLEMRIAASFGKLSARALDVLRWRGPLRFLILTAREILKPIAYWHVFYIFENDFSRQSQMPYPKLPFEVRIYGGESDLAAIEAQLCAMGELRPDDIRRRARRGDLVGIAYSETGPVGYSWMSCCSGMPLVFGATWILQPDEAILYGSFVLKEWRGKGIHSCLDVALNGYAREHGIVRTLGSMALSNSQALALAKRTDKRRLMIVALGRFRGINRTWTITIGAPLNSRFQFVGS